MSGNLLVIAYALLGTALWQRNGSYTPAAFGLVAASFTCTVAALLRSDRREPARLVLLASLGCFLCLNAQMAPGLYLQSLWFAPGYQNFCGGLLLLGAAVLLSGLRAIPQAQRMLVGVAVTGAIFFRILMPIASPAPVIDVYAFSQESAQLLLKGRNPYVEKLRAPYRGHRSFVVPEHFAYPPANLYPLTIVFLAFGDVRYFSVAADLIVALVLNRIVRKRWSHESAALIPLLFLFHPCGLFVVEQAWTEPILLATFAVFILLQVEGRSTAAAAVYGYFLSLKQYLLFFILYWFIVERNIWRLLLGVGVAAATAVPFVLWDFDSFWEQAILFNFTKTGFREDSLSITSALYPLIGPVKKSLSVTVGAVVSLWTFWAMRNKGLSGYCSAVTISTFAMFVFGSQAFCNYYYFVGGLMLFTLLAQFDGWPPAEGHAPSDSQHAVEHAP